MPASPARRSLPLGSTWRCSSATWRTCGRRFRRNKGGRRRSWSGNRLTSNGSTAKVCAPCQALVKVWGFFCLRFQAMSAKSVLMCFLLSWPFIATVQEWIVQEKRRLAAITEESGIQADLLPAPLLERLTNQNSADGSGQMQECPAVMVRAWKKLVEEELLKHHALCRAESRIRRKRLHYQLQRIARKRRLLEAKRELQRLERALPVAPDSPDCPESEAPAAEMRGRSFSADLLSRLYPQNTPIFRYARCPKSRSQQSG